MTALFMHNSEATSIIVEWLDLTLTDFVYAVLIRPTAKELEEFGEPDFTIYNAGQFPANRFTAGMTSQT